MTKPASMLIGSPGSHELPSHICSMAGASLLFISMLMLASSVSKQPVFQQPRSKILMLTVSACWLPELHNNA